MESDSRDAAFKREMMASLPNLRAFGISLAGDRDRADDLIQDTLLKAWAARERFELGSNMQAWLITIYRNQFYSLMRKRRREVEDAEGVYLDRLAVNPSQDDHLSLQDFQATVSQLVPEQREALLLVGASGFSYEQAAEICGCKPGTIKSRVGRARQHLRELMPDDTERKIPEKRFTKAIGPD